MGKVDRRWYGRLMSDTTVSRGVVQIGSHVRDAVRKNQYLKLPEHVLRLAQTEYEYQYGIAQDYERMQERMGLSLTEVISLLADYVDRLGGQPTKPRV